MGKYQNVETPRFYVDYFQYALTTGLAKNEGIGGDNIFGTDDNAGNKLFGGQNIQDLQKLFYLNPTNSLTIPGFSEQRSELTIKTYLSKEDYNINYLMTLGHNFNQSNVTMYGEQYQGTYAADPLVNYTNSSSVVSYNGWSLSELTNINTHPDFLKLNIYNATQPQTSGDIKIGCISIGTIYEMPHSPDLDLTMTREFGGAKKQFTKGGALLTNYNYTQPPTWGDGESWGLYTDAPTNLGARRAGRRTWDLKFSYLSASDIMADLEMLNLVSYDSNGNEVDVSDDYDDYLSDTNFFSQFMQKTLGGSLRFIFQPNGSDYNPDGFAICVLDQDSISIKQVAHNTYNISLRIMEVW
tara:strand:- start:1309 stop:2370 length:1062 start_codon:yes stop_codon:yes gene_type:complete